MNYKIENAPPSQSCRILSRTIDGYRAEAVVRPGFVTNTFILIVNGKKPYLNMKVRLSPLIYIRQPEYWGIEVVGCTDGVLIPAVGAYEEFLPLDHVRGTKGVEVIWADNQVERFDIGP